MTAAVLSSPTPGTRRRRIRRLVGVLVATVAVFGFVPAAYADHDPAAVDRIAGSGRIETAAEVAEATFEAPREYALLARAGNFPDALSGTSLAGALDAPVLLTARDELSGRTLDALERLRVNRVVILGGPGAVNRSVAEELRDRGYAVDRVAGDSRFATAAAIARAHDDIGEIDGNTAVFVAWGGDFADALAAGAGAYAGRHPVLLTTTDELHPDAAAALDDVDADLAVIVGGRGVVSEQARAAIEDRGVGTVRVAGRDRADTAQRVATFLQRHLGFGSDATVVTRGDDFPDALSAAPHAAAAAAPLLLNPTPDDTSYDQLQWIVERADAIELVRGIGGSGAITDRTLAELANAAGSPRSTVRYAVGVKDDHGEVRSDPGWFAEHADWTLVEPEGWALDHDVRFRQVPRDGSEDLRLWLASPQDVDAAADGCSERWSCRVGDDVYINDRRWRDATRTYRDRRIGEYRHYVVVHEIGHWIGLDHLECADHQAPGEPAPVMDQQSIDTGECTTNVWPLAFERDRARDNLETGGSGAEGGSADVE